MSYKEPIERKVGQYIKYFAGIVFLAIVSSFISYALLEILGYKEILLKVLFGIWFVLLNLFLWNTKPIEYAQHTETMWESRSSKVGELCLTVFMTLFFAILSSVFLGALLQWTLKIDILESDNSYRLTLLVWAGWILWGIFNTKDEAQETS